MMNEIETAARAAAQMTRIEYNRTSFPAEVMDYNMARDSARFTFGLTCKPNTDVVETPDNAGAAILKLFDDMREEQGLPRKHAEHYRPRIFVN